MELDVTKLQRRVVAQYAAKTNATTGKCFVIVDPPRIGQQGQKIVLRAAL